MIDLLPIHYALLFAAGFSGGFIDSIAGGGGLITVPALLAVGLPPQIALGTNKVQSSCGTTIAVRHYLRAGWMTTPRLRLAVAMAFVFSIAGALAVTVLSKDLFPVGLIPRSLLRHFRGGEDEGWEVDTFISSTMSRC